MLCLVNRHNEVLCRNGEFFPHGAIGITLHGGIMEFETEREASQYRLSSFIREYTKIMTVEEFNKI